MYGCFLFCCEWALCAPRSAAVALTASVSRAETWTLSEKLLTAEQIKTEVVSVKRGGWK